MYAGEERCQVKSRVAFLFQNIEDRLKCAALPFCYIFYSDTVSGFTCLGKEAVIQYYIPLIRERRKMQISSIGFWESWRRGQSINRKRVWLQMGGALSSLLPWQHTLHAIESKKSLEYSIRTYFF